MMGSQEGGHTSRFARCQFITRISYPGRAARALLSAFSTSNPRGNDIGVAVGHWPSSGISRESIQVRSPRNK